MHYSNPLTKRVYSLRRNKKKRNHLGKKKLFAVSSPPPAKRARNIKRDGRENVNSAFIAEQHGDPIYEVEEKTLAYHFAPQLLLASTALS